MKPSIFVWRATLAFCLLFLVHFIVSAQNSVGIGIANSNNHAVLELVSPGNNQGFLVPRLTTSQRTASSFTSTLSAAENGLLVYDSDLNAFFYWSANQWVAIPTSTASDNQNLTFDNSTGILSITNGNQVTVSGVVPGGAAGGALSGNYPNPTIANNAITTQKIAAGSDGQVLTTSGSTVLWSNVSVAPSQITQSTASTGQVLKWNGSGWVPQADDTGVGTLPALSTSQLITNNGTSNIAVGMSGDATFSSTGALTIANNAITTTKINNTAVTTAKIADASVTDVKIAAVAPGKLTQAGATTGQALRWNGTTWTPQADVTSGTVTNIGTGTGLTGGPITSTGTIAIAANGVTATELAADAVTSAKILDGTIATADLANNAVTTTKITDASVTSAKILDGTVATADLANNAVTTLKITDASVTDAKIAAVAPGKITQSGATAGQALRWSGTNWAPQADVTSGTVTSIATGTGLTGGPITGTGTISIVPSGVTTTELAADAVTTAKILDGTIATADLANNAVTTVKITDASVTSSKILDATIATADLADNAVTTLKITDASVTDAKIAAVAPGKLTQASASTGQVLKWSGVAWTPQADNSNAGTVTNIVTGTGLTGGPITGTGTISIIAGGVSSTELAADAVTSAKILDGTIVTADLANNAVTTVKITDASVTSAKILDATVATADLADAAITDAKIAAVAPGKITQSGATNGQALRWNGTTWTPQADGTNGTVTSIATGTGLAGGPITGTGTISIAAGGVSSTELATNAVTTVKITDASVTDAKIAAVAPGKITQAGATTGQALRWNGTTWTPQADGTNGTVTSIATGTGLTGGPITGTGTIGIAAGGVSATELATDAVTSAKILDATIATADLANNAVTTLKITDASVTSTKILDATIATADLADNAVTTLKITDASVTDAKIAAVAPGKLTQSGAAAGQVLKWSGAAWTPQADAVGTGTVTSIATGTGLSGGPITGTGTVSIAAGGVSTTELANNGVTVGKIAPSATNGQVLTTVAGATAWAALPDNSATNEIQNLGNSVSGTQRTITISGGTSTTIDVADNDNSAANEIQGLKDVLATSNDAGAYAAVNFSSLSVNTTSTQGALNVIGSQFAGVTTLNFGGTSYAIGDTEYIILAASTSAKPFLLTLPDATKCPGRVLVIRSLGTDASTGFRIASTEAIDGVGQTAIMYYVSDGSVVYAMTVVSNGKEWYSINKSK